jgi:hypothetical protein
MVCHSRCRCVDCSRRRRGRIIWRWLNRDGQGTRDDALANHIACQTDGLKQSRRKGNLAVPILFSPLTLRREHTTICTGDEHVLRLFLPSPTLF